MSPEVWLPVPGYEGRYEVSDHGRVRSLPRWHGRPGVLTGATRKGYRVVALWRDNKPTTVRVNRLVAIVFHRPPAAGEVCRHLNGDSLDNRASNLAWGTDEDNAADTVRMGRHHNGRKTHCKRQHPYDDENTQIYVHPKTGPTRVCRACRAIRNRPRVAPSSCWTSTLRGSSNRRTSSPTEATV